MNLILVVLSTKKDLTSFPTLCEILLRRRNAIDLGESAFIIETSESAEEVYQHIVGDAGAKDIVLVTTLPSDTLLLGPQTVTAAFSKLQRARKRSAARAARPKTWTFARRRKAERKARRHHDAHHDGLPVDEILF